MTSEKFQNACANIMSAGMATTCAGMGIGTIWVVGGMIKDAIHERRLRKKHEKEEADIDEQWEAYKMELDEMIQKNQELLAKTEAEIEG